MTQELETKILEAIYFTNFTDKQRKMISKIVSDQDITSTSKANEICDFLEIERRGNRSKISEILNQQQ